MAQLWGGRFTKDTDQLVYNFNASISFDKKFYKQDMEGSIAHVKMLGKQGILEAGEAQEIMREVDEGKLKISHVYEDIHSFVEATLIDRLGDVGKKLHTGRSRNDQVALDMRLYTRQEVLETDGLLEGLLRAILTIMEQNTDTFMPGFTHLQKAQPVTLAHHMGAYFEMFKRDRQRMEDIYQRMNYCPLGSGALAGTTYALDRYDTARQLGFVGPTLNSMDGVSDRDFCVEYLSALSLIMTHLSRLSEELILWSSWEFKFIELSDGFTTGSSIMPQKKNPDIAELVRGKTGRVYGDLLSALTMLKGLPLAYNKDMQEDKEGLFDASDTVSACLDVFAPMISEMRANTSNMRKAAEKGFINATDLADYLVKKGLPFRTAYKIAGKIVAECADCGKTLETLNLQEYKKHSDLFDNDLYSEISLETCVNKRISEGGPSLKSVEKQIEFVRESLKNV